MFRTRKYFHKILVVVVSNLSMEDYLIWGRDRIFNVSVPKSSIFHYFTFQEILFDAYVYFGSFWCPIIDVIASSIIS